MIKGRNIVVGISGASGAVYSKRLIEKIIKEKITSSLSLVITKTAKEIWEFELQEKTPFEEITYSQNDFYAPFASGSSDYDTLIVCPCSMGMLGRIANGTADCLIARTADVMLKERRRLILVLRETPLSLIHIENMHKITKAGGICLPASPSFYSLPETKDEIIDTVVERILSISGFEIERFMWNNKI